MCVERGKNPNLRNDSGKYWSFAGADSKIRNLHKSKDFWFSNIFAQRTLCIACASFTPGIRNWEVINKCRVYFSLKFHQNRAWSGFRLEPTRSKGGNGKSARKLKQLQAGTVYPVFGVVVACRDMHGRAAEVESQQRIFQAALLSAVERHSWVAFWWLWFPCRPLLLS